jgi:LPS-assembly protein
LGEVVGKFYLPKAGRLQLRDSVSRGSLLFALCLAGTAPAFAIVNKPLIEPITTAPVAGTAVNVEADKVTYDPKTKLATATGKVVMVYGPYTLVATRVEFNQVTGAFKANGSVELREPNGNVLQAQKIALTDKFKRGFAEYVKALLTNNATITADYARRIDDNVTVFEKVTYTACKDCGTDDGRPLWEIDTDQTTHDSAAHNLYHVNPRLKIRGVTVLAAPYWVQPDPSVKRRSGWLTPYAKFGSVYGAGLVTPYFWALAPNYDVTFTPLLSTKQGIAGDIEWRHRLQSGYYNIQAFGAYQRNPEVAPDNQTWRGAIKTRGDFAINQDWGWGWQGTFASDPSFLDHYSYDYNIIAENNIHATGLWDQTYVSAQALDFESLNTAVNPNYLPNALPYVSGEKIIPDVAFGGDLKFNWNAYSIHRKTANTPFTDINHATDQTRATSSVEWKTQLISDAGVVVSPFAKLRADIYVDDNVPDPSSASGFRSGETTTRVLPTVGVDMRYPFIASFDSGQSIVSPVFQLVSAADETDVNKIGNEDSVSLNLDSTSLFLTDRFTGLDRFEGGTRANLGLTYSFLGNNGNFLRASVGESFHLAGKNSFAAGSGLSSNQSDLVGALTLQPWEALSLSYEARLNQDLSKLNRQEATASLTFDRIAANLSYLNFGAEPAYGRNVAEHWISSDLKYRMTAGWSIFGGASYDIYNSVLTRKTAGLEFDCECMNFKVSYIGTEDAIARTTEKRLMLSVDFATLGGTSFSSKF